VSTTYVSHGGSKDLDDYLLRDRTATYLFGSLYPLLVVRYLNRSTVRFSSTKVLSAVDSLKDM
jgi:hypothetical protein